MLSIKNGWWNDINTLKECHWKWLLAGKLTLIHSEISEAMEDLRDFDVKELSTIQFDENGKPYGFPIELADATIRIMDLAQWLNINLQEAITIKHEYNKQRPYKHGRKRI